MQKIGTRSRTNMKMIPAINLHNDQHHIQSNQDSQQFINNENEKLHIKK